MISILILLMIDSIHHVQITLEKEQQMEQKKSAFQKASGDLKNASNYLSEEARKFVVTGEKKYLDRYVDELYTGNARNKAFEKFQKIDLTKQEKRMLNVARENFNMSIFQEIRAMKLMAEAMEIDSKELPDEIRNYILNVHEKEMTKKQKRQQSIQLLFEYDYVTQRDVINEYIQQSQERVYEEIEKEALKAGNDTKNALNTQAAMILVVMAVFGGMLFVIYHYIIAPIVDYREKIQESSMKHSLKIDPQGTREVHDLGEALNLMHQSMCKAMEAESRFIAAMSHEIRTPLNSLVGYEYLLRETGLNKKQKKYADLIRRASKNLLHLIQNILDYSKLEQEKIELYETDIAIRDFFTELRDIYEYMAQSKGLYLRFQMDDDVPKRIHCDEDKLRHILTNLISNGLKFTKEGGIKIFVHVKNMEDKILQLLIQVEDSGIGILEEEQEKIFGYFDQAHNSFKENLGGSGLGLHISRKMAELMGGTIGVDSIYGMGSLFNVNIPVTKAESQEDEPKIYEEISFHQVRVLLVEDNQINQRMEQEILSKFGIETTAADNGYQGMAAAQKEVYDLIFMDLRMEGMDGFATAQKIRTYGKNCETPIIALTADTKARTWDKIKEVGMDEWLAKPFEIEELLQMLMKYLPGRFAVKQTEGELKISGAVEMLEGDVDLYKDLVERFLGEHEEDILYLPSLWKQKGEKPLGDKLHMLKGVCGTIGAWSLQEAFENLEQELEDGVDGNQVVEELNRIVQIYKTTSDEMRQYLEKQENRSEKKDHRVDLEHAKDFLNQWEDMVQRQDFEALAFWKEHKESFTEIFSDRQLEEITRCLEQFAFSECLELLKEGRANDEISDFICG